MIRISNRKEEYRKDDECNQVEAFTKDIPCQN